MQLDAGQRLGNISAAALPCATRAAISSTASIRPRCRRRAGTPVGGAGLTLEIVMVAPGRGRRYRVRAAGERALRDTRRMAEEFMIIGRLSMSGRRRAYRSRTAGAGLGGGGFVGEEDAVGDVVAGGDGAQCRAAVQP